MEPLRPSTPPQLGQLTIVNDYSQNLHSLYEKHKAQLEDKRALCEGILSELLTEIDHCNDHSRRLQLLDQFSYLLENMVDKTFNHHAFQNAMVYLNRYSNIYPYDWSIVSYPHLPELEQFYINASRVYLPGNHYIATQGPLAITNKHFFKMIIHEDIDTIVNLAMEKEGQQEKCYPYWDRKTTFFLSGDEYTILPPDSIVEHNGGEPRDEMIYQREFPVFKNGSKIKTVTQFHYQNWPDHGVPDQYDTFLSLLHLVKQSDDKPIVVHCSAGIGRTGAFMTLHSLLGRENRMEQIIPTIIDARLQRPWAIQTECQLDFVFSVIARLEHHK